MNMNYTKYRGDKTFRFSQSIFSLLKGLLVKRTGCWGR